LLVGVLFVAAFVTDVAFSRFGILNVDDFLRLFYHLILIALLVVATFIDYDLYIIPDSVTVPGMIVGVALGAWSPWIRPEPSAASTPWEGLLVGLIGWAVGGGIVWAVRILGGWVFRREAMGFGDVTLMAMIGAFLGWQAAVLTFFLAPFFGIAHALWKLVKLVGKMISRRKVSGTDRELPFGPYLSLAALTLLLTWPWLWPGWARGLFEALADFKLLLGL
jgi:leader peptidase (prepilin peptidase) / N-methyltransferase